MRTFTLIALLIGSIQMGYSQTSETIRLRIDPTTQCQVRYHYFPNLEAYFDLTTQTYLYNIKGEWITSEEIPKGYRGYSMYNKTNVAINDYDDDNIIQFLDAHRQKYPYVNGRKTRDLTASAH